MKRRNIMNAAFSIAFLLTVSLVSLTYGASNVSVSPKSFDTNTGTWLTVNADVAQGADVEIFVVVDFNGNGAKEPQDWIMRYNKIKEGVAPSVPNSPKPGDEDGLNSHLLTRLDCWEVPQVAGNYIVIVKDAGGEASDTFKINQVVTGQSVSGTLRDESGTPIVGLVYAEDDDENDWETLTNADGSYKLYLPAGKFEVGGESLGYLSNWEADSEKDVSLTSGDNPTGIDLTLYDGDYTVSGRVVDTSTSAGVSYILLWGETERSILDMDSICIADANGHFQLPVKNGDWEIGVEESFCNYRGITGETCKDVVIIGSSIANFNFSLFPATTYITGKVTKKSDSSPLIGYEVCAELDNDYDSEQIGFTRDDGSCILLASPGTWEVGVDEDDAIRGGFVPPPNKDVNPAEGSPATEVNFQLEEPSAFINVNVKESGTSNPVIDVGVWINDEEWHHINCKDTNDQGNVSFGVLPGNYHVGIDTDDLYDEGYCSVPHQDVTVKQGDTKQVNFEVQKGEARIQGTVSHNGSPVPGIYVTLQDEQYRWLGGRETDANGFYFLLMLAGTYNVRPEGSDLVKRNLVPVPQQGITVSAGTTTLNFNVESPTLTLNVHILGSGVPLEDINVWFNNNQGQQLVQLPTDSSGVVTIGLTGGRYEIGFHHEDVINANYLPKENQQVIAVDGQTLDVNFNLHPYTAQCAVDVILGKFILDNVERSYLDANNDWRLDVGDIVSLINQGR